MERKVETWRLLRRLHNRIQLPWGCLGNFNGVLFSHEKQGGAPRDIDICEIFMMP